MGLYRIDNAETTADLTGRINPAVTTGIAVTKAFTGRAISKILVHPTNPDIVFVATSTGIAGLGATAIEAATAVPPLAVLGLYRSMNATAASPSFEKLVVTNVAGTRLLAGDARSENSRVVDLGESANFVGSSCTTGSGAVRKSTDGGATWSARLPGEAGFCGSQCSYDLPIEIDPGDANLIYLGGKGTIVNDEL